MKGVSPSSLGRKLIVACRISSLSICDDAISGCMCAAAAAAYREQRIEIVLLFIY
jgi:hypothetical protein